MGRLLAQRPPVTPAGLLEPDALVEGVCVITTLRRGQEELAAAAPARLVLHHGEERPADSAAAMRLVDDECPDLRGRPVALERRGYLQMGEPDRFSVEVGDDDPVADDPKPLEALLHRPRPGRIAELSEQTGDRRGIRSVCVPDRRIHATRLWRVAR